MRSRKTRILFDAHPLLGNKTGVSYYTERLVSELAGNYPDDVELVGYYHNFLYRKPTPALPTAPNLRYRRIAFMPGQIVNLLRRFHLTLPVELLTLTRADFILYTNFLGLNSFFGTPSASVIHDLTFIDLPEYVAKRNLQDLRRFIPAQIRRSAFLITVSDFSKRRIEEVFGVKARDILVTPIPPERPQPRNASNELKALQKLGVSGNYILTVGTVEPRKNLLNILDAYAGLPEKLRETHALVVAGKIGWNCEQEVARMEAMKAAGYRLHYLGYVSDVERIALYSHAEFLTSASFYEGFGMPILESMSHDTPCAVSDIPTYKEVAGDAALYFDQNDPKAITAAWLQLINHPKTLDVLKKAGRERLKLFSWDSVAADLMTKIKNELV